MVGIVFKKVWVNAAVNIIIVELRRFKLAIVTATRLECIPGINPVNVPRRSPLKIDKSI